MKISAKQSGFSLVELAIVLVIVGLVLSALLLPLKAQRDSAAIAESEATLEIAKKALLGFAQAQGRLPCPATAASNGAEAPLGGGTCTQQLGFLPAATLGIQPTDAQGFALDAWNNRIQYAVTQSSVDYKAQTSTTNYDFTTSSGINNIGVGSLNPSLRVCKSTSSSALTCSKPTTPTTPEQGYLINNAVAVIFSTGVTGSLGSGGADESANIVVNDNVFVAHDAAAAGTANGEFDHMVTWITPYVLYNAMIQAGQLH